MALALCLGAVLLAAWFPAREAARVQPVEALAIGHLEEKSAAASAAGPRSAWRNSSWPRCSPHVSLSPMARPG